MPCSQYPQACLALFFSPVGAVLPTFQRLRAPFITICPHKMTQSWCVSALPMGSCDLPPFSEGRPLPPPTGTTTQQPASLQTHPEMFMSRATRLTIAFR
jgi:hypothetical protein